MGTSRPQRERMMVNAKWLRAEAARSLGIIEELSSYLTFLEAAREQKAKASGPSPAFEREVLANARRAEKGARSLFGNTLRILKHLKSAGIIDEAMTHWTAEIGKRGALSFADHWKALVEDPKARERFRQAGVSQLTIQRLSEAASRLTRPVEVQEGRIIVRREGAGPIVVERRRLLGGTIGDVLYYNHFDAAAEMFDRSDVVPGDTGAAGHSEEMRVDPLDVVLAVLTRAQRRLTAHVRKLEDTGLAVYSGGEPVWVGVIIIGVLLVAAIIVAIVCEAKDLDEEICNVVSLVLSALSGITLAITCAENPEDCDIVATASASRLQAADGSFAFAR